MTQIIPALLVESQEEFEQKLRLVEGKVKRIQVDVLDGSLFGHTSWHDAERAGAIKTDVEIELHLMVENPIPIVEQWQKHVPTFKRAIIHSEIHRPNGAVTGFIKDELGLEAGIAVNPQTPLKEIEDVIHSVDSVTIMGVHPGASGQSFEGDHILDKIRQARHHRDDLEIEIDGGVTDELIQPLIDAGATQICTASLIFKSDDPSKKLTSIITSLN